MDIMEGLRAAGGVARRSTFGRSADARHRLAEAVAVGALRDLGGGWVAMVDANPAVVAARRFAATITCASAAPFYRLQLLAEPDHVHLAVPVDRGAGPRRGGLRAVLHREGLWTPPEEVGVPRAPVLEVLARALRCLPPREAVVMIDSALNQRLIEAEEIARSLAGPGGPQARRTLARCDAGSRSAIETVARLALIDAGLVVEAAVVIDGVGEVDLFIEGRVVVECDGYAFHSDRQSFRNDRRRDRLLQAMGLRVLRFTEADITQDPQRMVDDVLAVLRR